MNNFPHHNTGNSSSILMTGHSHFLHILVAVLLRYGTANFSRLISKEIYRARFTGKRITINQILDVLYTQQGETGNFDVLKQYSSVGKMARVPVLEKTSWKMWGTASRLFRILPSLSLWSCNDSGGLRWWNQFSCVHACDHISDCHVTLYKREFRIILCMFYGGERLRNSNNLKQLWKVLFMNCFKCVIYTSIWCRVYVLVKARFQFNLSSYI